MIIDQLIWVPILTGLIVLVLGEKRSNLSYSLSLVMKTIPVGITYASFAGLCIIATTLVGMYKFNQMPDLYAIIGLVLIISGVLVVNLLGKAN